MSCSTGWEKSYNDFIKNYLKTTYGGYENKNNDGPYINDFSSKKMNNSDGSKTRWFSILSYVASCPEGVSKKDIIKEIWGINKLNEINIRGYHSKTFACMRWDKLLEYNIETRKWYIGKRGKKILKIS